LKLFSLKLTNTSKHRGEHSQYTGRAKSDTFLVFECRLLLGTLYLLFLFTDVSF